MLVSLAIRDIVLIDRASFEPGPGLGVLTGETGAGKSILLDALGLALGARGDAGLVRRGVEAGVVTAVFHLDGDHPAHALLADQGLDGDDDDLVIRRRLAADGRSRAFVNDQPVSIGLLRDLGACLVEVHGQHGERGLLDAAGHRALLDDAGGLAADKAVVAEAFAARDTARGALAAAEARLAALQADEDYARHMLEELDSLAPQAGEEEELAARRALMMNAERITEELTEARALLAGDEGAAARLRRAMRRLERVAGKADGALDDALAALERAGGETAEASDQLDAALGALAHDPHELEQLEERLFDLRALARKHQCAVDDLPRMRAQFADQLAGLEAGAQDLAGLRAALEAAEARLTEAVARLGKARARAARRLERAVGAELAPLKLDKARFRVRLEPLARDQWSAAGGERVHFEIATNPGAPFGPLSRIASGGELSRIALALKVALSGRGGAQTLVFDEADHGVGGAVADAVGERLARLAGDAQVLVVTHLPQVAARAARHWRVDKAGGKTRLARLDDAARREEIARMLAGARVTDEARAAADSLLAGARS